MGIPRQLRFAACHSAGFVFARDYLQTVFSKGFRLSLTTERFHIEARIAIGGAGIVYRAIERSSGLPVALKLLMDSEEFTHPLDIPALMRDTPSLRKIAGPHVARLLDAVDDPEGPVLVYQFLKGESADAIPLKRRVEQREALDIAAQFLAALECGEKARIPHGDWKPSNVVIGSNDAGRPFALVLDWGLAAYRAEPAPDSLPFLAPECLMGEPASSRRDIFSAGAVLHYLLRGNVLVGGEDRAALAAAWKIARPDLLKAERPDLQPQFVDWVGWLMDARPKKRPRDAAEARRGLAAFKPPPPPMAPRHLSSILSLAPVSVGYSRLQRANGSRPSPFNRTAIANPFPEAAEDPEESTRDSTPDGPGIDNEPSGVECLDEDIAIVAEPASLNAATPVGRTGAPWRSRIAGLLVVVLLGAGAAWWATSYLGTRMRSGPLSRSPQGMPSAVPNSPSLATGTADERRFGTLIAEVLPQANAGDAAAAHDQAGRAAPVRALAPVLSQTPGSGTLAWTDLDIGSPGQRGSSAYRADAHIWTIRGGGADIWLKADQFHFTFRRVKGAQILQTRVLSIERTDPWAKAGLMFREGSDPRAAHVALIATPQNGLSFQWRDKAGNDCAYRPAAGLPMPIWLRLERNGNIFTASFSKDKKDWLKVDQPQTIDLPDACLGGYCVTSHNDATSTTALLEE